jgi:PIN domain nuclease of toxin-antitoxin system
VRLLLDTHSFLWFVMGSPKLGEKARALIGDAGNEKLLSAGSLWEMAIKISLGKLKLAEPFGVLIPRQIEANGIHVLKIDIPHLAALLTLPFHHRDLFDRLLAAQCSAEGLPIASIDPIFDAYGIQRMW